MRIGVPLETAAGETRVAATPETAKKLKAQGHTIVVQAGAGLAAAITDEAYAVAMDNTRVLVAGVAFCTSTKRPLAVGRTRPR